MNARRTLAAVIVALALTAPAVRAQQQQQQQPRQIRIAVVNPSRIFREMQERKDLQEKMNADLQRLKETEGQKKSEIEKLDGQRKLLKPDHPQFEEIGRQVMQKAIEYETWGKFAKLEAERSQKKQMRLLFDRIKVAVGEVAKQQGIDVVLSDQQPELPKTLDQVSAEQLAAVLTSQHVLFASEAADLSNEVIATLDARYKANGNGNVGGGGAGGGGTTPAPAPAR